MLGSQNGPLIVWVVPTSMFLYSLILAASAFSISIVNWDLSTGTVGPFTSDANSSLKSKTKKPAKQNYYQFREKRNKSQHADY